MLSGSPSNQYWLTSIRVWRQFWFHGLIGAFLLTAFTAVHAHSRSVRSWALDDKFLPQGWTRPAGWHVATTIRHPSADGDFTGNGRFARAVLMTDGRRVAVVVFVDFQRRPGWTPANIQTFIPYRAPDLKDIDRFDGVTTSPPGKYPLPYHYQHECGVMRFMRCEISLPPTYHPPNEIFAISDAAATWLFGWNGHDVDTIAIGI